MASIHRRPESKYWFASWRDKDGRQSLRSTKQTERQKALQFAMEMERAARTQSFTEAQARKVLDDLLDRLGEGEKLRNPSIEGWLREWLKAKTTARTGSTAERYRGVVD